MRRHVVRAGAAVLGAVLVLVGVIAGGNAMRDRIKHDEKYQFPFEEIECNVPPGMDRVHFLGEVGYVSDFGTRIPLLEPELPKQLSEAFRRHPWVEVAKVAVGPGRHVTAELLFRTPVLAVRFPDKDNAVVRAVDGAGLLLPRSAETRGLPAMTARPPAGAAGQPWGDPRVEEAAKVAAVLRPHQDTLKLMVIEFDDAGGLALRRAPGRGVKVLWGRPPGEEAEGEADARLKLQRLLNRCDRPGGLDDPDPRTVFNLRTPE